MREELTDAELEAVSGGKALPDSARPFILQRTYSTAPRGSKSIVALPFVAAPRATSAPRSGSGSCSGGVCSV